jgi:metallo-beta-lactamase family protein
MARTAAVLTLSGGEDGKHRESTSMMAATFHGAARQVTGSCHIVECAGMRLLVDCGLFQGSRAMEEANARDFGFDPATIDYLLLTHAHLDHCGRIPLLVKRGFAGEIVCTAATRELARLVLTDAASLQEEDAKSHNRRRRGREDFATPLYTLDDALHAMDFFSRPVVYDESIALAPGVSARFIDAGHMLGSASIVLDLKDNGKQRTVLFSGDLGNPGRPLLRDTATPPPADYVVVETTYGDRDHRSMSDSVAELHAAIAETLERGGNVVIPTFALERAQEILFYLAQAVHTGVLPKHLRVFLDSPMAISATEIFRRHPECLNESARRQLAHADLFNLPGLRFTRDASESMAINTIAGGAVILAGSGMCTGGRVRHHLKHNLWRKEAAVVFVGYAVEGTPARRIIDGAGSVRLFDQEIGVRARIYTINGFSAHAGQRDLLAWVARTGDPRKVLLVHGEPDRGMSAFAQQLGAKGIHSHVPAPHERFEFD